MKVNTCHLISIKYNVECCSHVCLFIECFTRLYYLPNLAGVELYIRLKLRPELLSSETKYSLHDDIDLGTSV